MKTFKMLSFSLFQNGKMVDFPIIDGLLINQENTHKTWVLEVYISNTYKDIFEALLASGEVFDAYAVISFPDNEPAQFSIVVDTIKEINGNVSVLMKGTIRSTLRKKKEDIWWIAKIDMYD